MTVFITIESKPDILEKLIILNKNVINLNKDCTVNYKIFMNCNAMERKTPGAIQIYEPSYR